MIKLNTENLVERGVDVKVVNLVSVPPVGRHRKNVSVESLPFCGISYNVRLGDPVFGWSEDLIEPGIIAAVHTGDHSSPCPGNGLPGICSIGNKVKIITGEAPGLEGVLVGKSFAVPDAVIIDFPERVYQKLTAGDHLWILARGRRSMFAEYPSIQCYGIDPEVLNKFELQQAGRTRLMTPVCFFMTPDYFTPIDEKHFVPQLLCSFHGADSREMQKLGIGNMRFGDLIAITDLDCTDGFNKQQGAVTIGMVTLSPVAVWDIAFGVSVLLTCSEGRIVPVINPSANIGHHLGVGRFRRLI